MQHHPLVLLPSYGLLLWALYKRISFLWFAFEFNISASVQNHVLGAQADAPSRVAGMETCPLRRLSHFGMYWVLPPPLAQSDLKGAVYRSYQLEMLHGVGNSFGVWLLIRFFFSSRFRKSRSKQIDGVADSPDLACTAVLVTSLNSGLTSGDPVCAISHILCTRLGKVVSARVYEV